MRICRIGENRPSAAARYLLEQSDAFLATMTNSHLDMFEGFISNGYTVGGNDWGLRVLKRLSDAGLKHPRLSKAYKLRAPRSVEEGCIDALITDELIDFIDTSVRLQMVAAAVDDLGAVIEAAFEEAHDLAYGGGPMTYEELYSLDIEGWKEEIDVFWLYMKEHIDELYHEGVEKEEALASLRECNYVNNGLDEALDGLREWEETQQLEEEESSVRNDTGEAGPERSIFDDVDQ